MNDAEKTITDLVEKALQNPTVIQLGGKKAIVVEALEADHQDVEDTRKILDDGDHENLAQVLDDFFEGLPHKAGYDFVKTERIETVEQE